MKYKHQGSNKEQKSLISRIVDLAITFFVAALLIYLGTVLLIENWWVLAIVAAVIMIAVISYRIWKAKRYWE